MSIDFPILIFGLMANLAVIIVINRMKALYSVTNAQLISLCLSDILHLLSLPAVHYVFYYKTFPPIGEIGCTAFLSLFGFNSTAGIFHLTMLSFDRYMSVCHPIFAKRYQRRSTAVISVLIVWLIAFAMITPTIMFSKLELTDDNVTTRCFMQYPEKVNQKALILCRIIIGFGVPVLVNTIFYGLILQKIWKLTKNKPKRNRIILVNESSRITSQTNNDNNNNNTNNFGNSLKASDSKVQSQPDIISQPMVSMVVSRTSNRQQIHVTKIILTLLLVFIALWLPYNIFQLIANSRNPKTEQTLTKTQVAILSLIFNTLGCLNSFLNPILYGFISTQFRACIKQTLSDYHLPCGILTPKSNSNILAKSPVPRYPNEKSTLCCWRYLCICYKTSSYKAVFENKISR